MTGSGFFTAGMSFGVVSKSLISAVRHFIQRAEMAIQYGAVAVVRRSGSLIMGTVSRRRFYHVVLWLIVFEITFLLMSSGTKTRHVICNPLRPVSCEP